MVQQQHTLRRSVKCEGVGLHSGQSVQCELRPALPGTGLVFVRSDIDPHSHHNRIPALWSLVSDTRLCTRLTNAVGVSIGTVEHLMAAFAAQQIDNAEIHINGAELPIMDGSATPFIDMIRDAGTQAQGEARRFIKVLRTVSVNLGQRCAELHPAEELTLDYTWLAERSTFMAGQSYRLTSVPSRFAEDVASARTFGFLEDVTLLQRNGLARGGSLANSVVIDGETILNPEGLRYDDECVRHKVLDAVGDLYLAGAPLLARFNGVGSGHDLNHKVLSALMSDDSTWCWSSAQTREFVFPAIIRDAARDAARGDARPVAVSA